MVGMNWHCRSSVVTCPKIVEMMLPEPVSTIALSVVGPFGLMSGRGLSVALPDLPVVRFTHVTFNGRRCSAAGAGVPMAVNTYAVCPAAGPGAGIFAGPATEIAVASTLPPSARHPLLIDGYMKSCVGGASGPNAGAAAGAAAGSGAGAGAGSGAGTAAGAGAGSGAGAATGAGATSGATGAASGAGAATAASGTGPTACAGSTPAGRCASSPGTAPGAGTCATNWFTAVATFLESGAIAEFPA